MENQVAVASNSRRVVAVRQCLAHYFGRTWFRCVLLGLVGFAVHAPSLQGQMIWDDSYLIHDNPFIKSPIFVFEIFRQYLWLDYFSAHYRPVQNLSYMADYFLWNSNTYGFHLTNVLLHLTSGILLYQLLRRLFVSLKQAGVDSSRDSFISLMPLFVALLWIVHPVHSAAVDYISGRADSLAFLFACAGWLLFLQAQKPRSSIAVFTIYSLSALSALLALCSREIACIWFVLFILHLLIFQKTFSRRKMAIVVIGALAIVGMYAVLRLLPDSRPSPGSPNAWPIPTRIVLMLRALGDYGRLLVFPNNLHMERTIFSPQNYISGFHWRQSIGQEYLSILGVGLLAALIIGGIRPGLERGIRLFGALWFLLAYLPVSNIVDLNATVAEHWLYLPSVGFLIFLSGCALEFPVRFRNLIIAGASCAVVALGVRSAIRSSDWSTEKIFYQRTLAAGGDSTRVMANLAQVYSADGDYVEAEKMFRQVLARNPDYPLARNNLAEVFAREGKSKAAEALLVSTTKESDQTKKDYPRTWIPVLNLALYRHKAKDDTAALLIAEKARLDYPGVWEVIRFEAEILRETRGPDAALSLVESFTRDHWWHHDAALSLGRLYAEKGDNVHAVQALRSASWLDVHDAESLSLVARIHLGQNHFEDAYLAQRSAVSRQPDEPRQYALLSNILEKMGKQAEARDALAHATWLRALVEKPGLIN